MRRPTIYHYALCHVMSLRCRRLATVGSPYSPTFYVWSLCRRLAYTSSSFYSHTNSKRLTSTGHKNKKNIPNYLYHNFYNTWHFCQNWSSIAEVMMKNLLCVLYAPQCIIPVPNGMLTYVNSLPR